MESINLVDFQSHDVVTQKKATHPLFERVKRRLYNEWRKLDHFEYLLFMLRTIQKEQHSDGVWLDDHLVARTPITVESYKDVDHFCNHFMETVTLKEEVIMNYKNQITLALFHHFGLDFYATCLQPYVGSKDVVSLIYQSLGNVFFNSRQYLEQNQSQRVLIRAIYMGLQSDPEDSSKIFYGIGYHDQRDIDSIKQLYNAMKLNFSVVWDNEEYDKIIIDFMMKNKFPSCIIPP
jgi:hypothetical protein